MVARRIASVYATAMLDGLSIGLVCLRVADLGRSEDFYTRALGLETLSRKSGHMEMGQGGRTLVRLLERPGGEPKPRRATGLYHFAILVPSRKALGKSLVRLAQNGTHLQGADHLVSEALYLADPDGNGIEVYRDRPREEWPWNGDQVEMDNAPLDIEELVRETDGEPGEALEAGTKVGHVHLHVRDLDEAEKFYCRVLGFRVMQRWRPSALFVAAGGYHHHVGLNTWAGVGAPPPPASSVGLEYFTIELPADELAAVRGRLEAARVNFAAEGEALRLYDPSQNGIRFGVRAL